MATHPRVTRSTFLGTRRVLPPAEVRRALAIALVALNALSLIGVSVLVAQVLLL